MFWHYLDASAMVKIIANDPDEDLGRKALCDYYFANSMYRASSFCVAEALSAFKLKWLRERCSQDEYFRNVREFFRLVLSPLRVEECSLAVQVQQEAERLMQAYQLDFVDSIQIVTLLKGTYSGLVGSSQSLFITADRALAVAARQEGARVWDCTSEAAPS